MTSIVIHNRSFKIKIPSTEIQEAVLKVATKINSDLKGKKPLFLCVLNGSFMFASDLLKKISIECEISFVKISSYQGTSSTGVIHQLIGMSEDIKGRTVVIVEDIVDTGNTIENVWEQLKDLGAAELKICTLLFKPEAYTKKIPIDYVAMSVPNDFLLGYGLDFDGLGRNLEDIYVLEK